MVLWTGTRLILELGSNYIEAGNFTASGLGNQLNITWEIRILWHHPDIENMSLSVTTTDNVGSVVDTYDVDWDVETRLEPFLSLRINDGLGIGNRGDINCSIILDVVENIEYKTLFFLLDGGSCVRFNLISNSFSIA